MAKFTLENAIKATISNQGVVPYEQQTPEQRRELIGKIQILILSRVFREVFIANLPYLQGSIPANPTTKEMKMISQRLKAVVKTAKNDIVPFTREMERLSTLICTNNDTTVEQFDAASFYVTELINNAHGVSIGQLDYLHSILKAIQSGKFTAVSDEDHENEMVAYGQYCMELAAKGRKKVTKNDYKNFKKTWK